MNNNKLLMGIIFIAIFSFKECSKTETYTSSKRDTSSKQDTSSKTITSSKIDSSLKTNTSSKHDSSTKNLINNPSFEIGNKPSLSKWKVDTVLASLVKDALPGYGEWSLKLTPGWFPQEGLAETYVTGISESGIFKLTVWMKSLKNWEGSVSIGLNNTTNVKKASNNSAKWSLVTVLDTLSLKTTDTLFIRLSAGRTESALHTVLFDNVSLEKIK